MVVGPRGVGKTTCMVQHLLDRAPGEAPGPGAAPPGLYVLCDHVALADLDLYELAVDFSQLGGRVLCLDEVHKREGWQAILKSIYETMPDLQVVASGSSALHVLEGSQDLARRAVVLPLEVLSFREYLAITTGLAFPPLSLPEILEDPVPRAEAVVRELASRSVRVLPAFQEYLAYGSYPYFLDFQDRVAYLLTVEQNVRAAIESDLLGIHPALTGASARRIRRLLSILAASVPFVPDLKHLARLVGVGDERTLKTYLGYLEDACLIRTLRRASGGLRELEKPEKVYLHATSLSYATAGGRLPDIGNVRETFLLSMLAPWHEVTAPAAGDFLVDGELVIEVGGRTKTSRQVRGAERWVLALDGLEVGVRERIPLWLFGFLY